VALTSLVKGRLSSIVSAAVVAAFVEIVAAAFLGAIAWRLTSFVNQF
jgi:hypothetical protein